MKCHPLAIYIYQVSWSCLTTRYIYAASTAGTNMLIRMPISSYFCHRAQMLLWYLSVSPQFSHHFALVLSLNTWSQDWISMAAVRDLISLLQAGASAVILLTWVSLKRYWRWSITTCKTRLDCILGATHHTKGWEIFLPVTELENEISLNPKRSTCRIPLFCQCSLKSPRKRIEGGSFASLQKRRWCTSILMMHLPFVCFKFCRVYSYRFQTRLYLKPGISFCSSKPNRQRA